MQKLEEQDRNESTKRLPYDENMAEKNDKKSGLHLLHDMFICIRGRVVLCLSFLPCFSSKPSLLWKNCAKERLEDYSKACVFIPVFSVTFTGSSLHVINFTENFYP